MLIRFLLMLILCSVGTFVLGQDNLELQLIAKANALNEKGLSDEAADIWYKALELNLKHETDTNTTRIYSRIGKWNCHKGNYNLALENHQDSFKAAAILKDSFEMAGCLANIGGIHQLLGNDPAAFEYLEESYAISEITDNQKAKVISLSNLANLHSANGNFSDALKANLACLEVYEEMGVQGYVIRSKISITGNYIDLEAYDLAEENMLEILNGSSKDPYIISFTHALYAEVLLKKGDYDGSLIEAKKARVISEENNILQVQMMSYGAEAEALVEKSEFEGAYKALEMYQIMNDSLKGIDKIAITKEIDAIFKLSEHKRELIIYQQRDSLNLLQKQQNSLITERIKQRNQFLISLLD